MTVTNDFLLFCPTDTGTNLESQSTYAADPNRTIGNQPGVASSKLNNKALRQANAIASNLAQYIANVTGTNLTDDDTPTKLLSQTFAAFGFLTPIATVVTATGAGTFSLSYKFKVLSANATTGATYSDGTNTFTVVTTIAAGLELIATGPALPATLSGTLTKTGGTGDATITYNAVRAPLYLDVFGVGGGGGGGGSASGAAQASAGGGGGGAGSFVGYVLNPTGTIAYSIGTAGAGGIGVAAGGNGANTTFGAFTANAGTGGSGGGGVTAGVNAGGPGGGSSGASLNAGGNAGANGFVINASVFISGQGGGSAAGGGGVAVSGNTNGNAGTGFGGGGGGASSTGGAGSNNGGAGTSGYLKIVQHYQ